MLNELSIVSGTSTIDPEVILILQVNALNRLVSKAHDPRDTVSAIKRLIKGLEEISCTNALLLVLVKSITRAIFPHALDVLQICK